MPRLSIGASRHHCAEQKHTQRRGETHTHTHTHTNREEKKENRGGKMSGFRVAENGAKKGQQAAPGSTAPQPSTRRAAPRRGSRSRSRTHLQVGNEREHEEEAVVSRHAHHLVEELLRLPRCLLRGDGGGGGQRRRRRGGRRPAPPQLRLVGGGGALVHGGLALVAAGGRGAGRVGGRGAGAVAWRQGDKQASKQSKQARKQAAGGRSA